jgi:hypothetical protein
MNILARELPLPAPASIDRVESYPQLLDRLNEISTRKCHDPYRDIAWDTPENRIDPADLRMRLWPGHNLAQTDWYRSLTPETQARFGIEWAAQTAKYAISFEAVLSRGLLEFTQHVPNRSPEYRYAMHELVEEGRHSMMFQELINRTGTEPRPVVGFDEFMNNRIAHLGRVILQPDRRLVRDFSIPRRTLREVFGKGSAHRRSVAAAVEPVRKLCDEHGLLRPRHTAWWRALGLLE